MEKMTWILIIALLLSSIIIVRSKILCDFFNEGKKDKLSFRIIMTTFRLLLIHLKPNANPS